MWRYFSDHRSVLLFVFSIIATVAVALRFWARRILKIRLELNAYLVVLDLTFALVEAILYIYSNPWWSLAVEAFDGSNDDAAEGISSGDYDQVAKMVLKIYFLSQIMWAIAVTLIRSSVILLYIRIFPTRSFRHTCYAVLAVNVGFCIGAVLTDCLICLPTACRWEFPIAEGCRCGDQTAFDSVNAVINLLLDITTMVLPMPLLWRLQMAVSKKLILSGMFGLGIRICVVTAIRVQRVQSGETWLTSENSDGSSPAIMFLMCSEAILGVLNACLPVLKPVFRKIRDSMTGISWLKGTKKSMKSGSIPIFMRVSQIWQSRSWGRSRREGLDSIISMDNLRRSEGPIQSSKVENVLGTKVSEIHVQRDLHVESDTIEV